MADFLKGLIQLAAAGVKHREGVPQGVTNHARRAAELFRATGQTVGMGTDCLLGLRIRDLIKLAETVDRDGWLDRPLLLRDGLTDESN